MTNRTGAGRNPVEAVVTKLRLQARRDYTDRLAAIDRLEELFVHKLRAKSVAEAVTEVLKKDGKTLQELAELVALVPGINPQGSIKAAVAAKLSHMLKRGECRRKGDRYSSL